MGNKQGFQGSYAVCVNGRECTDMTPPLRAPTHPDELVSGFQDEPCPNSWYLFQRGKGLNNGRNCCLGYRETSSLDDWISPEYSWYDFNKVEDMALTLGTKLLEEPGCMPYIDFPDEEYPQARKLRLLGLFSKNRVEWFVCEQAANAYDIALVPIYNQISSTALKLILEKTRMPTIGCSLDVIPQLLQVSKSTKTVRFILVFCTLNEKAPTDIEREAQDFGIKLLYFNELIKKGPNYRMRPICCGIQSSINTICFTSGTTGDPKGVLLTHGNLISCAAGIIRGVLPISFSLGKDDIALSYLPLAHVLERLVCNVILAVGGSIGVYSGDTHRLLEDIRVLNPTIFVSVPRVFNRILDLILKEVHQKSFVAKFLFHYARNIKLDRLKNNALTENLLWDHVIFKKTKNLMGTRMRLMISGGAALDASVQDNLKVLFCVPLMEGYGLSETFGPAFLSNLKDPVSGHVGGVIPGCEFALLSVDDMSYKVTDNPPRGELLLRGPSVTVGYFRDKNETRRLIDKDGWFHTGDIAVLLPRGSVKIIDRKKNIFKLAQGEYVVPEKVEAVYLHARLVSQIFVFGYSHKNALVAIVVPDEDTVREVFGKTQNRASWSLEKFCGLETVKSGVLKEMEEISLKFKLYGYEKVKKIHLVSEPFSSENGLLTPTMKIKRFEARTKFQEQIDRMYNELEKV